MSGKLAGDLLVTVRIVLPPHPDPEPQQQRTRRRKQPEVEPGEGQRAGIFAFGRHLVDGDRLALASARGSADHVSGGSALFLTADRVLDVSAGTAIAVDRGVRRVGGHGQRQRQQCCDYGEPAHKSSH